MKKGKRYIESAKLVDKATQYEVADALDLAVKTASAKFDETVELHVKLGVDGRNADQQVRGVVVLPHGTGKSKKILALAKGDNADIATKAGADFVGAEDMVAKIQNENWLDFDVVIATPDMMGLVGRLGKVSFGVEKLTENLTTVMDALIKAKPAAAKGTYIKSVSVSSTMGPGIRVQY